MKKTLKRTLALALTLVMLTALVPMMASAVPNYFDAAVDTYIAFGEVVPQYGGFTAPFTPTFNFPTGSGLTVANANWSTSVFGNYATTAVTATWRADIVAVSTRAVFDDDDAQILEDLLKDGHYVDAAGSSVTVDGTNARILKVVMVVEADDRVVNSGDVVISDISGLPVGGAKVDTIDLPKVTGSNVEVTSNWTAASVESNAAGETVFRKNVDFAVLNVSISTVTMPPYPTSAPILKNSIFVDAGGAY